MVINFNVKLSKWKILEISDSSKEKIIQFLEISHFSLQPDIHQVSSHFWISIQKRFNFDNWQSDCYLSYRKISLSRCNYHDLTTIGILHEDIPLCLSLSLSHSFFLSFRFPSSLFQATRTFTRHSYPRHRFWAPFRTLSPRHVDYIIL